MLSTFTSTRLLSLLSSFWALQRVPGFSETLSAPFVPLDTDTIGPYGSIYKIEFERLEGGMADERKRETEESVDQSSASVFARCSDLHLQKKTHVFLQIRG